jgi:hypothetical protein
VVYVLRDSLLVDGHPMSSVEPEMELRNVLQAKRELEARMENPPKRGLVIQAEEGVPEARVKRIKALAHQMGYYDAQVMRIPAREKPAKAKARRGS